MARAAGISATQMSMYVSGEREPNAKLLASMGLRRVVRYEEIE